MSIIVQKFGGSSVANVECIQNVAKIIKAEFQKGNKVIAVVSAMFGTTDNLISLCDSIHKASDKMSASEYDAVISSGEQISAGLVAMALINNGIKAVSMNGWQIGLKTDDSYSKARILGLYNKEKILQKLNNGFVVVVPGFQGISSEQRTTTLGRGGSDASAIAIAISIGAARCDIYKDVKGVYTTDPRICENARKIDHLSHEEMLEMSSTGSKVLQTRAVEMAMRHNFPINVRSTFDLSDLGTIISGEKVKKNDIISGISHTAKELLFSINRISNFKDFFSILLESLILHNIEIDILVTNEYQDGDKSFGDISFSLLLTDLHRLKIVIDSMKKLFSFETKINDDVVKISIVGSEINEYSGIAGRLFKALGKYNVPVLSIGSSPIKISTIIPAHFSEFAIKTIHDEFFK